MLAPPLKLLGGGGGLAPPGPPLPTPMLLHHLSTVKEIHRDKQTRFVPENKLEKNSPNYLSVDGNKEQKGKFSTKKF